MRAKIEMEHQQSSFGCRYHVDFWYLYDPEPKVNIESDCLSSEHGGAIAWACQSLSCKSSEQFSLTRVENGG